jgi:membrane protein YqaA with SNARE-associated domain
LDSACFFSYFPSPSVHTKFPSTASPIAIAFVSFVAPDIFGVPPEIFGVPPEICGVASFVAECLALFP